MRIVRAAIVSGRRLVSTRRPALLALCAALLVLAGPSAIAQSRATARQSGWTTGVPSSGAAGIQRRTADLMDARAAARLFPKPARRSTWRTRQGPERRHLPQHAAASSAGSGPRSLSPARTQAIGQTASTTFTGATLADSGLFPPDAMGAVGPAQFVVLINGRLRTFDKATGAADAVLDLDPDAFFNEVMSSFPDGGLNYTSNPQVRYDRLTKRWILTILDNPSTSADTLGDLPNRLLLAVSDAASHGVISGSTVWTFYGLQQDTVGDIPSNGQFLDYASLGVDASALYVGGNMFDAASGAFVETSAFVIRKSSILSGGPIVATAFRGLVGATDGPYSPRGVDNYDPEAAEGYIIGVSFDFTGLLMMRRISTPGETPAISDNIEIPVSPTAFPASVDHLGNTLGVDGNLDARDDALFAAHIRSGRLWTAHAIAVTAAGLATDSDVEARDGVRWYELMVPADTGTPTVNQSGTIFDTTAAVADARQYWFPSIAVSGQGHAAVGFSTAGTPFHIDAATTGRLASDAVGTMGPVTLLSASETAYNPPDDASAPRRWGEYSFTSLDPDDDMTLWTIQEFNDAEDSYGLLVARLLAPPPATPFGSSSVPMGSPSVIVSLTGSSLSGSGFFDPGPGFANRLAASVTGGVTVNSVTFTDDTHVVLDISTVGAAAGTKDVTITNPDGQTATGTAVITVTTTPPTVTTGTASAITATAATLSGTANPNGTATTAGFEFGPTMSYGFATVPQNLGSGSGELPIGGGAISGLTCATTYHFRATATNPSGTATGLDASFTTLPCDPPCTFSLLPSSASVPGTATTGSVLLTASASSCAWTAVSHKSFIAVTSAREGTGTATVTWSVTGNRITTARTGTIAIAGQTFTITQAGGPVAHHVPNDFNHDGTPDVVIFRPGEGRFGSEDFDIFWGAAGDMPVAGDFNGDGNADIAVFRPANGTWYIKDVATIVWGAAGDIPVPGDYDGNGTTDIAVFRPSTGMFLIRNGASVAWGLSGDLPVVGDYNGDGTDDIAVYRPATGTWYVRDIVTAVFGLAADIPAPADYNGDGTTDIAVFRPATGTWIVKDQYTQAWGLPGDVPVPFDRDGDGVAELVVFRPSTGIWYFKNHVTDASETLMNFFLSGDIPLNRAMPPVQTRFGDFDGDRKADLTVFRPSTGDWVSLRSLSGMTDYTLRSWGLSGDVPVSGDYDGDGKIDFAVFRPSSGRWYVLQSSTGFSSYVARDWGLSTDLPVPGDYDGDGRTDFAVFRPSLGHWLIHPSSSTDDGYYVVASWGVDGDVPMPADYDGDGRTDLGVFHPANGRWSISNGYTGESTFQDWGVNGDVPIAADFDGDGKADLAVFRPSTGQWFIKSSIDGSYQPIDWGLTGDVPVPADYDGDGKADIAVFRPSNGTWYVRGLFNRSWGLTGDIPALKNP